MKCTLYLNNSSPNTVNKSITQKTNPINCNLKENTSIETPILHLSKTTISDTTSFNYLYLDRYKRYYYVVRVTECIGSVLEIDCKVDVLMSHKDKIKSLNAIVERQQNFYNLYLPDLQIPNYAYKRVQTFSFPQQPLNTNGNLILAVCGRG